MGNIFSNAESEPPQVVLVPPMLDSRERGRSRFAKSSYDRLFAQPQRRILFGDYISTLGLAGALRFSPPEDPRINIVAKLAVPDKHGRLSNQQPQYGGITLRYQPQAEIPWTFFDIKAKTLGRSSTATIRGCYFDQKTGMSVFGILPLLAPTGQAAGSKNALNPLRVGFKYSSPELSVGAIINPASTVLHSAWAVARTGGLIFGCQTTPSTSFEPLLGLHNYTGGGDPMSSNENKISEFGQKCADALSWSVAYQPEGQSPYGKGIFTAVAQMKMHRELTLGFLHHMALQRNVHNIFEKNDVVGITNYVDVGCEIVTDLTGASDPSMRLAASWQANKNLMLKGKVGLDGASTAIVFKSWWQPAFTLALAASKDLSTDNKLRFGLTTSFETYRSLRYERSTEGNKMSGGRVTQRHVASEEDVAYSEGRGLLVPLDEVNNPEVLGQMPAPGGDYL